MGSAHAGVRHESGHQAGALMKLEPAWEILMRRATALRRPIEELRTKMEAPWVSGREVKRRWRTLMLEPCHPVPLPPRPLS